MCRFCLSVCTYMWMQQSEENTGCPPYHALFFPLRWDLTLKLGPTSPNNPNVLTVLRARIPCVHGDIRLIMWMLGSKFWSSWLQNKHSTHQSLKYIPIDDNMGPSSFVFIHPECIYLLIRVFRKFTFQMHIGVWRNGSVVKIRSCFFERTWVWFAASTSGGSQL